jgi:hypothetical protein
MRYITLVLLNIPIIMLALMNILTQYKTKKVSKARFRHQIILWVIILILLIGSFPFYNFLANKQIFDSSELSLFDIAQTTVIIFLIYAANHQRQRIDQNEKLIRDLHREISIKLSSFNK